MTLQQTIRILATPVIMSNLLLLVLLSILIGFSRAYEHVIYIDDTNGILDDKCWLGGIDLPCKTLSLAREGKKALKDAIIAIVQHETTYSVIENSNISKNELTCPPWMFHDENDTCKCGKVIDNSVQCKSIDDKTYLYLLIGYCLTYNKNGETELGRCFYGSNRNSSYRRLPYNKLELNKFMCAEYKRSGTMCGKCKTGYSPLVYSYEMKCVNCTNPTGNWIRYVCVAFLPLTFFYLFVILFEFSGTSPQVRAFIFVSQSITAPLLIRNAVIALRDKPFMLLFAKIMGCIYGVWNLDFFRPVLPQICLNIAPLLALALDYAVAFYPLLLVYLTSILIKLHSRDVRVIVWLWRPFKRCCSLFKAKWDLNGSVVNAFATFFLLSYVKFLTVTFDLLLGSTVYTMNETNNQTKYNVVYKQRFVVYFDGTVEIFSKEHLPYALTAVIVSTIFIILPLLLLLLYPMKWFQSYLNRIYPQRHVLETYINCFQGYYKDGTNGTRDFRYFSTSYLLIHMLFLGSYAFARSVYVFSFVAIILIIATVITLVIQPYKPQFKSYALTDAVLMLNLASFFIMVTGADEAVMKASYFKQFSYVLTGVFVIFPLFYMIVFSIWWVFIDQHLGSKFCLQIKYCLRKDADSVIEADDIPHRLQDPKMYERLLSTPNAAEDSYGSINNY